MMDFNKSLQTFHEADIPDAVREKRTNTSGNSIVYEIMTEKQFGPVNAIVSILSVVFGLCGVVTNAINIVTFIRMGLNDTANVSFFTLALSDFVYTLLTVIARSSLFLVSIEITYDIWFTLDPGVVTFYVNLCGHMAILMTTQITVFLALVRCACVALPFRFKTVFTLRRSVMAFICFAGVAFGNILPLMAESGVGPKFDPERNATRYVVWLSENREKVKDITITITYIIIPVIAEVVTAFCVSVMISKLKSAAKLRNEMDGANQANCKASQKLQDKERAIILQIVIISTVFIICNAVKVFHALCTSIHPKYGLDKPYKFLYITIAGIRALMDCLNSSVNFLIFLTFNSRFRSTCFSCKIIPRLKD